MQVVKLLNGHIETISDNQAVIELVREYTGNDLADLVDSIITKSNNKAEYERRYLEVDFRLYETQVKEQIDILIELRQEIDNLKATISTAKRLNRERILETLNRMKRLVENTEY